MAYCAGESGSKQVEYLVCVLQKIMVERHGRNNAFADINIVSDALTPELKEDFIRNHLEATMKLLDAFYKFIAVNLLENADFDILNLRSSAEGFMVNEVKKRETIEAEARKDKAL